MVLASTGPDFKVAHKVMPQLWLPLLLVEFEGDRVAFMKVAWAAGTTK